MHRHAVLEMLSFDELAEDTRLTNAEQRFRTVTSQLTQRMPVKNFITIR